MGLARILRGEPWSWPREAPGLVLEAIDGCASGDELLFAIDAASHVHVIDEEIARVLLALIEDQERPATARAAACIALGPVLELADMEGFEPFPGIPLGEDLPISEKMFEAIHEVLKRTVEDLQAPTLVRRRALEAAVRSPRDWQRSAVGDAFALDDPEWRLTAVFAVGYLGGFEREILDAIGSDDRLLCREAVTAAGLLQLDKAWRPIGAFLLSTKARKNEDLMVAVIQALAAINPEQAGPVLAELIGELDPGKDELLIEVAEEAMMMAEASPDMDLDNIDYDWD